MGTALQGCSRMHKRIFQDTNSSTPDTSPLEIGQRPLGVGITLPREVVAQQRLLRRRRHVEYGQLTSRDLTSDRVQRTSCPRLPRLHQCCDTRHRDKGPPLLVPWQRDEVRQGLKTTGVPAHLLQPPGGSRPSRRQSRKRASRPTRADDSGLRPVQKADAIGHRTRYRVFREEAFVVVRELSAADLRECCQRLCHGHALGHRS